MCRSCFGKLHIYLLAIAVLFITNVQGQGSYNTTNWRFSNPKPFGFTVVDLDFADNNRGIGVGSGIAYTHDGGANWTYGAFTYPNPTGLRVKGEFTDVHFITPNTAYAVGNFGLMAKTTD